MDQRCSLPRCLCLCLGACSRDERQGKENINIFNMLLQNSVLVAVTTAHLAIKVAALRTLDCHRCLPDRAAGCWLRQETNDLSLNVP